jgi:hypothetical protein
MPESVEADDMRKLQLPGTGFASVAHPPSGMRAPPRAAVLRTAWSIGAAILMAVACLSATAAAAAAPAPTATPSADVMADADLKAAAEWVKLHFAPPGHGRFGLEGTTTGWHLAPDTPKERELALLTLAITRLPTARERTAGLRVLATLYPESIVAVVGPAAEKEKDPAVCAVELLLLGLARDAAALPVLRQHLKDPDATVRTAAADALGILHRPAYPIPVTTSWLVHTQGEPAITISDPPILLEGIMLLSQYGTTTPKQLEMQLPIKDNVIDLGPEVRAEIEKMMTDGETLAEREAAARALLAWPPEKYRLRVAEWGVWIARDGQLQLVQSVLDEIPAFVHRTGNPVGEFAGRVNQIMEITKPIVHLTVDQPMAVDLEARIELGRPWFAYPRPDDFGLEARTRYGPPWNRERGAQAFLAPLDNDQVAPLKDLHEGYPWLWPEHRVYGAMSGVMGAMDNDIAALGLRWQSLIVLPKAAAWMKWPDVPADPKFRWWSDLRAVPTSYVSSRGEAERFLYYDGPTLACAPVKIALDGDTLSFTAQEMFPRSATGRLYRSDRDPEYTTAPPGSPPLTPGPTAWRAGLFIRVAGGKATAWPLAVPVDGGRVRLAESRPAAGADAEAALLAQLIEAGLTADEAGGLITCWRKLFFQTDGQRFLLRLRPADYEAMCPMTVRPAATEGARVGLVLTEFGPAAGNDPGH